MSKKKPFVAIPLEALEQAIAALEKSKEGELSEAELDGVAGGVSIGSTYVQFNSGPLQGMKFDGTTTQVQGMLQGLKLAASTWRAVL